MKRRQAEKRDLKGRMERSGDTQVSSVDPDARLLRKRGQVVAGYNAQIAVDSKHKLVVTEQVVQDGTDTHQLAGMLVETKKRLGVEGLTGLADGGITRAQGSRSARKRASRFMFRFLTKARG